MQIIQAIRDLIAALSRSTNQPEQNETTNVNDTPNQIAWGAHVSTEFRAKVRDICRRLWPDLPQAPSWLMACMAFETGRTFSPSIKNPNSSGRGLIQFMEATAKELGTSTSALARMTAVKQLDYVEKYFQLYGWYKQLRSLDDFYMRILWPRAMGKSSSYALWQSGTNAYRVNRGLDTNRDGIIVKSEAASKVRGLLAEGLRAENAA